MATMKPTTWDKLPRQTKLARALFPHLASEEDRREMADLARGEGKKAPYQNRLLSDAERGCVSPLGNVASGWPDQRKR